MNGICGMWTFRPFQLTLLSCFIVEICADNSPSDRLELGKKISGSGIFRRSLDAGIGGETSDYSKEAGKIEIFMIAVL
jgi:hypothetical protein